MFQTVMAMIDGLLFTTITRERSRSGVFAHFKDETQTEYHLQSHLHEPREIISATQASGFELVQTRDVVGSAELVKMRAKWERLVGAPILKIWQFQKS